MFLEKILNDIKIYRLKKLINNCIKHGQINNALFLSKEYRLLKEEFQIYDLIKKQNITSPEIVERLSKFGVLKQALEFSKLEPMNGNTKTIIKIDHDLRSNDSKKIAKTVFKDSDKGFWRELYCAKENQDYSEIKERVIEYNLIELDSSYLNCAYSKHVKN